MSPKKPIVAGAVQWEAPIIDSSKTGHGPRPARILRKLGSMGGELRSGR
jgi:hypothetical protein